MKQKVNPAMIVVAVVVLVGLLAFMYRHFLPASPPSDTDNAKGMPLYAQKWREQKKNGQQPSATSSQPVGQAGGDTAGNK